MTITRLEQTPDDRGFVDVVARFIGESHNEIGVIAGELSAYNIPELKHAAHAAADRGVRFIVYANRPDTEVAEAIRSISGRQNGRLKIGPIRSRHHYMVTDRRNVVVSLKELDAGFTVRGTRTGIVYENEPAMAEAVRSYLTFIDDVSTGVEPREVLSDLLVASLRNPTLVREIPFAENVLELAGLSEHDAQRYSLRLQRQFSTWVGEGAMLREPNLLQCVVNGTAIQVAQTAIEAGQDIRWSSGTELPWGPASPGAPTDETDNR